MANEIFNFFRYNDLLAAGGQPTKEQIEKLQKEGYEAIINLSPVSTKNYFGDEAAEVERSGMEYVHYPVDCSNLKESHFLTFSSILKSMEGKRVFVHCGGNVKSSNLIHMYHVVEKGEKEEKSLKMLKKIQVPEEKWIKYFRSFGMAGLN